MPLVSLLRGTVVAGFIVLRVWEVRRQGGVPEQWRPASRVLSSAIESIGNRGIRKTQLADFVHLESLGAAFQAPATLGFQLDILSFFL